MQVKVTLGREMGVRRQPYGQVPTATGELSFTYLAQEGRNIPVLQLLANGTWPHRLFEPRLTQVFGPYMRFMGFERTESGAWVMQEWDLELL